MQQARLIFSLIAVVTIVSAKAQLGVGPNIVQVDPSAMLEVRSTVRGFLGARMSANQRLAIGTPANGLLVYDNDSSAYMLYAGGSWTRLLISKEDLVWKRNGANIYGNYNGYAGIGTSTPTGKLEIEHQSAPDGPTLKLTERDNDGFVRMELKNKNAPNSWVIGSQNTAVLDNDVLGFYHSSSPDAIFQIDGQGNMGVGRAPSIGIFNARLNVNSIANRGAIYASSATNSLLVAAITAEDKTTTGNNGVAIAAASGTGIAFLASSAGRGIITLGAGKSGFGVANPVEMVQVNGAIKIGNTASTNDGTLRYTGSDFQGYTGGQWRSLTGGPVSSQWIQNGNNLTNANSGNVGIGADPASDSKLDVRASTAKTINAVNTNPTGFAVAGTSAAGVGGRFETATGAAIFANVTNPSGIGLLVIGGKSGFGILAPTEQVDVNGAIRVGTTNGTNAGSIRYNGTDLQGYVGGAWKSLTGAASPWAVSGNNIYNTNTGNIGLGTAAPKAFVNIPYGKTVLFGDDSSGIGKKAMWLSEKGAFRAGYVTGNEWDAANVGSNSAAFGVGNRATGANSFASGSTSEASGATSTVLGFGNFASGEASLAAGYQNSATRQASTALGYASGATADRSFAAGSNVTAKSFASTVVGMFNDITDSPSPSASAASDRIFQVGNGNSNGTRANALTILKNGNASFGTASPKAAFHVPYGKTVLFGDDSSGIGKKAMWLSEKGAFRAGYVTGNEWDAVNVGSNSAAFGVSNRATGANSFAAGSTSEASGSTSTALGFTNTASGEASLAAGYQNSATRQASAAFGYQSGATAERSFAAGSNVTAKSFAGTVVGIFNDITDIPSPTVSAATDRIFQVGNGNSNGTRANALTILKNGSVGVGTTTPAAKLEVAGQVKITGGVPGTGKVLTSDADGLASWQPASALTLPFSGTAAIDGNGVIAVTNTAAGGYGLFGKATTGAGGIGVLGRSESANGVGLRGLATALTGVTYGVSGSASSPDGFGGNFSNVLDGIALRTTSGGVQFGSLTGAGSRMVVADALGNLSTQALPNTFSLPFSGTAAIDGNGVIAVTNTAAGGYGLFGKATTGAGGIGVLGRSESANGVGLRGLATALTGVTYGVSGSASSPDGFGGNFSNVLDGIALRTTSGGVQFGSLTGAGSRMVVADALGNLSTQALPGGADNWGSQSVVTSAVLSGNGTVATPLTLASQGAQNGYVLKYNGTTWLPAADNTLTLPYTGNATTANPLISIVNNGTGVGINSVTGAGDAVSGSSASGVALRGAASSSGTGVYGASNTGTAGLFATTAGTALQAIGPVKLGVAGAAAGKFLKATDANGNAEWADAPAGGGSGPWTVSGNDINNSNTGKVLVGPVGPVPASTAGILLVKQENSFGVGIKSWTSAAYGNAIFAADSGLSGGPRFTVGSGGSTALDAYSVYGDALFAYSSNGRGIFLKGGSGFYPAMKIELNAAGTTALEMDGQIKINGGSPGAGKVLTSDANGLASWQTASGGGGGGSGWGLSGNSGISASNFIGTTTNADVIFKQNNVESFRVKTGGALLVTGNEVSGVTPASGAGSRLMWIPAKAAFRAGNVSNGAIIDYWDDANIGYGSMAGGINNKVTGSGSFAMGNNNAENTSGHFSNALFGNSNTINNSSASLLVGQQNTITGSVNAAAIGQGHTITGLMGFATGNSHTVGGQYATAMGNTNVASGYASLALGDHSTASAQVAVAIGNQSVASGSGSFALGSFTNTNSKAGAWCIGDFGAGSTTLTASTDNTLNARFKNGYYLYTNSSLSIGAFLGPNQTIWDFTSDSTKKEKLLPVNGEDFLNKIAAFKLNSWNYKGQDSKTYRHYGPMAQDFHKAFGQDAYGTVGCDTTINTGDFAGVSFIAIQALEKRTSVLTAESKKMQAENRQLKEQNEVLALELAAIKKQMNEQAEMLALKLKQIEKLVLAAPTASR